jgi:hypothetical protein
MSSNKPARASAQQPVKRLIAIAVEGGRVTSVVTDDPDLLGVEALIIDYDTDSADEGEITRVAQMQSGHQTHVSEALLYDEAISPANGIDLPATWRAFAESETGDAS